ncbi:MAG: extracellular solute-binding protein [Austwickia sp.]|nr:extracellular solute-binding protein [Austwickia sp.]MBK8436029.1 extracellular solute-binding protein [Austwickia sp.]MBK9101709.1 extracellular solute-binding protein [Austwickia sp.]
MPRRRTTRSLIGTATVLVCAAAGLSGCGSGTAANELTWYINPDGGGSDPTKGGQAQLAAECTKAAAGKYSIKIQLLPNSASDQRQQLLRRLAAADPGMDIMSMDPVFVAEFAEPGYLDPVPADRQAALMEDAVKPIVDSAKWKDRFVAAPMWANTQLLWYRKSVAKAAGLDMSKPVTWDQLIAAAQSQKKAIGVQARLYEGYTVWINALIEGAGGSIIESGADNADAMKLGLESPAGKAAAGVIRKVSDTGVGGPAMGSTNETTSLDTFMAESTSGFMLNWPYVWASIGGTSKELLADVGYARYPQTVAGQDSRPPFGGIELGVNAASTKKANAWAAIECITSAEHQKLYMLKTGNPAARKSVYSDPEVLKVFPMAQLIRDSLDGGAPRPLTQYYGDVSTALQKEFSPPSSVDPNSTPAQATQLIKAVLKGEALL